MPNNGTGKPTSFICAACRRRPRPGNPRYVPPPMHDYRLTGRTRKRSGDGGKGWGDIAFEYECACGHIGWTRHPQVARRAKAEGVCADE